MKVIDNRIKSRKSLNQLDVGDFFLTDLGDLCIVCTADSNSSMDYYNFKNEQSYEERNPNTFFVKEVDVEIKIEREV